MTPEELKEIEDRMKQCFKKSQDQFGDPKIDIKCSLLHQVAFMDIPDLIAYTRHLEQWVSDLQSGIYVNCVYCGHRFGSDTETPVAFGEILKQHIAQCPKHPMNDLKKRVADLETIVRDSRRTK